MSLFDGRTPEARFWDWFLANRIAIASISQGSDPMVAHLGSALARYREGLAWEKGTLPDGRHHLIVSAEGQAAHYRAVRTLIGAAPNLAGWEITAFRPKAEMASVVFEGVRTTLDELAFVVAPSPERGPLNVTFLIPGYKGNRDRAKLGGLFVLLDALIGEENAITKLGTVEVHCLDTHRFEASPLSELATILDCRS